MPASPGAPVPAPPDILTEGQIPESILRLLATPISRSDQTWYVAATQDGRWLLATLWQEPPRGDATRGAWGIALRGDPAQALVDALIAAVMAKGAVHGASALLTDAVTADSPFHDALLRAGFARLAAYRLSRASTLATLRGLGLGVRGAPLQAAGWSVSAPREDELPLLMEMFRHQLGHIPPQLVQLAEDPAAARPHDHSRVLRRSGKPVAAVIVRQVDRHIDAQGLVCHPRWRAHRAFAWLLAELVAPWPPIADVVTINYPESNAGMVDIARRMDARPLVIRHELIRPIP